MEVNKNDKYYIEKMKVHFERILDTMTNITYDEYLIDLDKQDITMFNIIQISENAKLISDEYKENNIDIPWADVHGLRNRIVHDYGNVVLDTVYLTLSNDIPLLYDKLYGGRHKSVI